jgi:putative SOS response-associated peptidase YedK
VGIGAKAINARAEEVENKPMFRQALIARRAVIPASGYYEWKTEDGVKTPYYIHPADDEPLFFAGLYEWWKDPAKAADDPSRWVLSFTIMTRDAVGQLGSIHDRMPLFIDADYADVWLDPTTENVGDLLDATIDAAPALVDGMLMREVDRAVGNVRNNGPQLIAPLS